MGTAGPGRTAAASSLRLFIREAGDSLPLLPGSSRTAAAASQTGPDDLAAELNPHERGSPRGLAAEQIRSGAFRARAIAHRHGSW